MAALLTMSTVTVSGGICFYELVELIKSALKDVVICTYQNRIICLC